MRAPRALPGGRLDAHNANLILSRALSTKLVRRGAAEIRIVYSGAAVCPRWEATVFKNAVIWSI